MPPAPPAPPPRSVGSDIGGVWSRRRQIWRLVSRRDKLAFGASVLTMAVVAQLEATLPILLGKFTTQIVELAGRSTGELMRVTGIFLGLLAGIYVLKESLQLLRRWFVQRTTARIEGDMTVRLVSHLLKIDLGAFAADRVGALHGRITRSVQGFVKFLKVAFTDFLPAVLSAGFALAAGILTEWRTGLVMLGVVPVSVLLTVWQVRSQKGIRLALMHAREGLDGTVVEQLSGLEYIRAANTMPVEVARIQTATQARREGEIKHGLAMARFDWAKGLNQGLFHVIVIAYAIYLVGRGEIAIGVVVTQALLFIGIMRPLHELHRILDETYETSLQVSVLMEMLNQPLDKSFGVVTLRPPRLDGSIPLLECQDLVVEYPTPTGPRRILDGVTLAIRQGQTIGIAGPSGSGKSTWLRAVLRLLHPTSGEVLVGGVPIGVLSREDIGKSIGYVSQVPFVFSGTVRENIAYGCGEVSFDQIVQAAQQAHIHEEIEAMPRGYDSMLNERGSNLSGGQRQR
ncbi:MAG TPA: ABC transporter ATP-binding protein, partial [Chthoniobacterales bacterium]|nr:ABC transporter ATP-binding protein [Chthoniobacterales bacterium]